MNQISIASTDVATIAARLRQIVPPTTPSAGESQLHPIAVRIINSVLSLHPHSYDRVVYPRLVAFMSKRPDTKSTVDLASLMDSYPHPLLFMKEELCLKSERKGDVLRKVVRFVCTIVEDDPTVSEEHALKQWAVQAKPQDYRALNIKYFALAGFQHLRMLFGADTVKPDTHICRFISEVLNRNVSDVESLFLLRSASARAGLSARAVDLFIWKAGARGGCF